MKHVTEGSLEALKRLRHQAGVQGDETMAVLLAGLELYITLGREYDLLDSMRKFAIEMREPVEHTPTAADLDRLYRWDPEQDK